MQNLKINYRHPYFDDGLAVYELVKSCPPLDINSIYYYYILCRDFSKTCVVAERDNQIIGFISSYRKPLEPGCLFVWQVAVSKEARGYHIATNMLDWLIEQLSYMNLRFLETTISPSNQGSQALFRRLAKKSQVHCKTTTFLKGSKFKDQTHETELLFCIGPFRNDN